jgi:hypothetical protein
MGCINLLLRTYLRISTTVDLYESLRLHVSRWSNVLLSLHAVFRVLDLLRPDKLSLLLNQLLVASHRFYGNSLNFVFYVVI